MLNLSPRKFYFGVTWFIVRMGTKNTLLRTHKNLVRQLCTIACFKVSALPCLPILEPCALITCSVPGVLITAALILLCRKRVCPDGSKLRSLPAPLYIMQYATYTCSTQHNISAHRICFCFCALRSRWCAARALLLLFSSSARYRVSRAQRRPTWPLQLSNMPGDMKRPSKVLFRTHFPQTRQKLKICYKDMPICVYT